MMERGVSQLAPTALHDEIDDDDEPNALSPEQVCVESEPRDKLAGTLAASELHRCSPYACEQVEDLWSRSLSLDRSPPAPETVSGLFEVDHAHSQYSPEETQKRRRDVAMTSLGDERLESNLQSIQEQLSEAEKTKSLAHAAEWGKELEGESSDTRATRFESAIRTTYAELSPRSRGRR